MCVLFISFSKYVQGVSVAGSCVYEIESELTMVSTYSGVKTEENRKGRILAGLRDMRRVLLEILPSQKSKEEPKTKLRKYKNI